jgi:hypothetical protein
MEAPSQRAAASDSEAKGAYYSKAPKNGVTGGLGPIDHLSSVGFDLDRVA